MGCPSLQPVNRAYDSRDVTLTTSERYHLIYIQKRVQITRSSEGLTILTPVHFHRSLRIPRTNNLMLPQDLIYLLGVFIRKSDFQAFQILLCPLGMTREESSALGISELGIRLTKNQAWE
jgi:hypothetical protein